MSQLTILVATVLIGFGLFARAEREHLDRQYQDRALAIAEVTASIPLIRDAMEYGDSGGAIHATAEQIRQRATPPTSWSSTCRACGTRIRTRR